MFTPDIPSLHSSQPARTRQTRVLVVEDEAVIALDVANMLSQADYHIAGVCHDVAGALATIAKADIDAAVLDLKLGLETAHRVADGLADRAIPFIWISGSDRKSLPRRHRERLFLPKPFTCRQFLTAMRTGCTAA